MKLLFYIAFGFVIVMLRRYIIRHIFTPRLHTVKRAPQSPFENIEIKLDDGKIRGWLLKSNDSKGCFLLVHGWGSSKSTMLRYADNLISNGYDVMIMDVLGHGESDPIRNQISIASFVKTITGMLDYVEGRPDLNQKAIYVLGHSMGGVAASIVNATDSRISALITDSMPTSLKSISQSMAGKLPLPYFPFGWLLVSWFLLRGGVLLKTRREWKLEKILRNQQSPTLAFHSIYDKKVPIDNIDVLLCCSNYTQVVKVATKGHHNCFSDPHFWETLTQFIEKDKTYTSV